MIAGILELVTVESQPHQPDAEGKQFVVAMGFPHNGAALANGLSRHGKA